MEKEARLLRNVMEWQEQGDWHRLVHQRQEHFQEEMELTVTDTIVNKQDMKMAVAAEVEQEMQVPE